VIGFVTTSDGLYQARTGSDGTEFEPVEVSHSFMTTLALWNRLRPKHLVSANPYDDIGCAHHAFAPRRSLVRYQHCPPCHLCLSERASG
jgi:hypothetical protein